MTNMKNNRQLDEGNKKTNNFENKCRHYETNETNLINITDADDMTQV